MSERQTVIYNARSVHDAHFLKNLLAGAQIKAVVLGDSLELGSGANLAGSPTSARVAVAEKDAPLARQIALEFDREKTASAAGPTAEGPQPEPPVTAMAAEAWPRCPDCDAPRSTRCPVCGTAGSNFSPADMGFVWIPDPEDGAYRPPRCSCGPGGCTSAGEEDVSAPAADEPESAAADESQSEKPAELLMCPTCDEPFPPQYPRLCEWCGHEFPDGFELELPTEPVEQINSRVIAVIAGLLVLGVAMAFYLTFIAY